MRGRGFRWPATAILSLMLASAVQADEAASVRAAADGLYAALGAGDASRLAAYIPSGGFTEFSPPEPALKVLDAEFFRRVLSSGVKVDLKVEDARVRLLGTGAVLTGFRVGSITLADGKRVDVHDCLTMLWNREQSAWRLHHVHISGCAP